MDKIRKFIEVKGIVQGVGFRPFVYNLAIKYNLKGWVNNTSIGVLIDIEGKPLDVQCFIEEVKNNPPPLAKVNKVIVNHREITNFKDFSIRKSDNNIKPTTYISPDYCTCDECKKEIFDKNNRRYRYAFTNCTNCGPRFTITKELPYDRKATTMNEFIMCNKCKEEYENPLNRRFHAQPNGCPICGPRIWICGNDGEEVVCQNQREVINKGAETIRSKVGEKVSSEGGQNVICDDEISYAIKLLKAGKIFTIKGLGGFNLACNGKNKEAITLLRERKRRPIKPLAVMMKDVECVKKYCKLSKEEEEILSSNRRPILLLEKLRNFNLPENLAPNNKRLGVMLPYTPMHYLLFEDDIEVLVMTSANISGEPMIYKNKEAIDKLKSIVDYYLINNREIYMPIDDSVSIFLEGKERVIRPGRGYGPKAISFESKEDILALGSELKNTIALSNKKDIFISEYIGDLKNVSTMNTFYNGINHFTKTYDITPKTLVYDMHPDFDYRDININCNKKIKVQHHHSHIVSCMAENNVEEKVIGIAFDGTGYGLDKKIWGGEFLLCDKSSFKRVGHLDYFKLSGGESAIKEPWKIAISLLYKVFKEDYEEYIPPYLKDKNYKIIKNIIDKNINSIETSSMGRLFDGVSALIGFNENITFEGEAAIYLQNISDDLVKDNYDYRIDENNEVFILNFDNMIKGIIKDINKNIAKEIIAKKFHNTVIKSTVNMTLKIREKYNINSVVLSGGVFQNEILFKGIIKEVRSNDFNVYTHIDIPCNDSGISFGQLIIANESL